MPELYLTPTSISYLTQFLLALIITIYLTIRFVGHRKQLSRQDGYLLAVFISITTLSLLFFLEYSLLPSERLIVFSMENTVVAILLARLTQFGYHFPAANNKQKIERRVVLLVNCAYILAELTFAIRQFQAFPKGIVIYRPDNLQYAMIGEFAWVVFVFARNAISIFHFLGNSITRYSSQPPGASG